MCEEKEERARCSRGRRGLSRHSPPGTGVNLVGGRGGLSELSAVDGWPKEARLEVEGREEEEESGRRKEKVGRKERKKRKRKREREKNLGLGSGFCVIRFFCSSSICFSQPHFSVLKKNTIRKFVFESKI